MSALAAPLLGESLARWTARAGIELSDEDLAALRYDWRFWGRPEQFPPIGDWLTWLVCAGRGFGKTRIGAEWVREEVEAGVMRIALIGPTAADVRDTMIRGESGILAVFPPHQRPKYEPSKRRITFHTGAEAYLYSAEEPDRLRGPQHERAWCDEPCAWRYLEETIAMLEFGMRLGEQPRVLFTSTPRPIPFFQNLAADAAAGKPVAITNGSTLANADNLPATFLAKVLETYQGTRLGEQEIDGKILTTWSGALWQKDWIQHVEPRPLSKEVIAIDPAISTTRKSDETGIVHAGADTMSPRNFCVVDDISGKWTTSQWAMIALSRYWARPGRKLVAETNRGGDMVKDALLTFDASTLRADGQSISKVGATRYRLIEQRTEKRHDPVVLEIDVANFKRLPSSAVEVVHGYKGKGNRAEGPAALYEQGRGVHFGAFPVLEGQMTQWDPTTDPDSPDRLDALVWAALSLGFADPGIPSLSKNLLTGTRRSRA